MTITERMVEIKSKLVEADREDAMKALTEYIPRHRTACYLYFDLFEG